MSYTNTKGLPECYKILNVSPGVNWVEIKKSYHALALKYHPDRYPDIERYENRFKEVSRAFKTLESHYRTSRRQEYEYSFDGEIEDFRSANNCNINLEPPPANQQNFFKSILRRRVDKKFIIDLKNQLIESLGQLDKKAFQLDIEKEIKIDSSTVVKGGTVRVCQNKENFEVPIPRGAWNRMKIRIPNKGEASWFSNKRGDLLLDVQVLSSNSRVHTGGKDLYYNFPLSVASIETGAIHTLMTAQGAIKFILPRNTKDGQTFTLKAKPNVQESLRTNHIVKIQLRL